MFVVVMFCVCVCRINIVLGVVVEGGCSVIYLIGGGEVCVFICVGSGVLWLCVDRLLLIMCSDCVFGCCCSVVVRLGVGWLLVWVGVLGRVIMVLLGECV